MAAATITTMAGILKRRYLPRIRLQMNQATVLSQKIGKDYASVSGSEFYVPLHYGRNEGVGARAENGTLPTAKYQQTAKMHAPVKYNYGRISITGPAMKATRDQPGAYAKALSMEVNGMRGNLAEDLNRQRFGDGGCQLAVCGATTASTTVVVDSGIYNLRVGMTIDLRVISGLALIANGDSVVIATVTPDVSTATKKADGAGTIVIGGAGVTTTTANAIYREDSVATDPFYYEQMGLRGLCAEADPTPGALQGLAVSANAWWVGTKLHNSGTPRDLTLDLLEEAVEECELKGPGVANFIITHAYQRRKYYNMLTGQVRFSNTLKFDGGWSYLLLNDTPIYVDRDSPRRDWFILDSSHVSYYRMADFHWMDQDGALLSRVSNADAYEATLCLYEEFGTDVRNALTWLTDCKIQGET